MSEELKRYWNKSNLMLLFSLTFYIIFNKILGIVGNKCFKIPGIVRKQQFKIIEIVIIMLLFRIIYGKILLKLGDLK